MDGNEKRCWLCGRTDRPLDLHHIFPGPYRSKSDRYGLVIYLCHDSCHIFGRYAVHRNPVTMLMCMRYGQEKAMAENEWSIEDFIAEFGHNYL